MRIKTLGIMGLSILAVGAILYFTLPYVLPIFHQQQPTPPITPTPNTSLSEKFIIFPQRKIFSQAEITTLIKDGYQKVLLDDAPPEQLSQIQIESPTLQFDTVGLPESKNKYIKCNLLSLADGIFLASTLVKESYDLGKNDCSSNHKITNIKVLDCIFSTITCQKAYLSTLHDVSYIYIENAPYATSFIAPQVNVDQTSGFPIITWDTSFPNSHITQASYSIELLNSGGKRVYASGKIDQSNSGDYYIPTQQLISQEFTLKLRIWYKVDTVALPPKEYDSTFDYIATISTSQTESVKISKQIAWIPDWGMKDGIVSVQKNPKKWYALSPVWFSANKNGDLVKESTYKSNVLMSLMRVNKIKVVPTISLFDADILKAILHGNLAKHVQVIVSEVTTSNFDGIDLDYESTYRDDQELLTQFVTQLATALHAKNKTLSFTALPKVDDRPVYAFLPQTHQAQDWQAIGAVVDEFRIMAYDFTGQGSNQPGPLSPILWDEALIKYALTKMPKEKVVLALPLYSHTWDKPKSNNLQGPNNDKNIGTNNNTLSWQHDDIAFIKIHSTSFKETYDTWNQEIRATMNYKGKDRVMYDLNKKAIDARITLGKKYGIAGVAYWRIGGEEL